MDVLARSRISERRRTALNSAPPAAAKHRRMPSESNAAFWYFFATRSSLRIPRIVSATPGKSPCFVTPITSASLFSAASLPDTLETDTRGIGAPFESVTSSPAASNVSAYSVKCWATKYGSNGSAATPSRSLKEYHPQMGIHKAASVPADQAPARNVSRTRARFTRRRRSSTGRSANIVSAIAGAGTRCPFSSR